MPGEKIMIIVKANNSAEAKEKVITIMNKYTSINNKTRVLTQREIYVMCTDIMIRNFEYGYTHYQKFNKDLFSFAQVCREYNLEYNDVFNINYWEESFDQLPTWKQYDEIMGDDIIPPNTPIDPADVSDIFINDRSNFIHDVSAFINFGDTTTESGEYFKEKYKDKFNFVTLPEIKSCYIVKVCVKN